MANYNLGSIEGRIQIQYDPSGIATASKDQAEYTRKTQSAGQALDNLAGKSMASGAVIAGGLGLAVKSAADFEKTLSGVKAVSGATADEMEKLRKKAMQIGEDTSFSSTQAALAMEELVKAGIKVDDVLNGAADATVALAAAGGTDLPRAAEIASAAMNNFNLTAKDMPRVADLIAGAANASAIDVGDFGESLKQAGASAALVGLSFDDLAVAITAMGNAGIKGSDAGTSLKTFLSNLQPSTKEQIKLFDRLGITTDGLKNKFFDAQGSVRSMSEIAGVLETALKGMTDAQRFATLEAMFGSDAIRAAAIITKEGAAGVNELTAQLGKITAAEVAKTRMDNFAGSVEELKGTLENAGIAIGTIMIPTLRKLADELNKAVSWFNALPTPVKETVTQALVMTAAFLLIFGVLVKVGAMIVSTVKSLWALVTGIGTAAKAILTFGKFVGNSTFVIAIRLMMINAVAAVQTGVIRMQLALSAFAARAGAAMATAARATGTFVLAMARAAGAAVAAAARMTASMAVTVARVVAGWVLMGVQALAQAARMAAAWLIAMGPVGWIIAAVIALVALIIAYWDEIIAALTAAWNWISELAQSVWGAIVQWFTDLWNGFVSWITGLWNGLLSFLSGVWNGIKDTATSVWNAIVNFLVALWNGYWGFYKAIWDTIVSVVTAIWNGIKSTATNIWNGIVSFLKGVWTGLVNAVRDAVNAIVNFFRNLWGNVSGAISNFASNVVNGIRNGVTTAYNTVVDWLGRVIQWFRDLPSRVLSALGNMGSFLYNAGKSLIEGFWNGIKAIWNNMVNWVKNGLSNLRGLWPFSPAKWGPFSGHGYVTYSGKALTMDFAKSILAGIGTVSNATERLMGAAHGALATPEMAPALAGYTMGAGSSTTSTSTTRVDKSLKVNSLNVEIPAKDIAEMQSVSDFFDRIEQQARASRSVRSG